MQLIEVIDCFSFESLMEVFDMKMNLKRRSLIESERGKETRNRKIDLKLYELIENSKTNCVFQNLMPPTISQKIVPHSQ